ncbi:phage portal protein [Kordiimonas aestuarii]|uniref:phage portal protein n=1 Tax=Kordiimonas aestuarii TaxID=1005925 RepID=UPI0021D19491|nr:phage portal protein [Kordiimonas aestuarii]
MAFWDKFKPTRPAPVTAKSMNRPVFSRVGPGQAVATPHRYDRLSDEGYRQNVIAYRAVGLVARACASVPMRLYRGDDMLSDHPILSLLARPNPRVRGENFIYNLVGYHLIAGNAYALAVGPDGRAPKELWLMRPDTVNVLEGQDGLPSGFEQKVAGKTQRYGARSVLHWKTFNPLSDWYGMAPLEAAALSVDAFNEGSRWNLALIQNGGAPSGVLYSEAGDAPLTDEQFSHLKAEVERRYTGGSNAGRPLLLEGGLKWQEMGMSPRDMDWTAAKNMSAREIAMAFGVPPQMLGIPDAQTYSNYSEARQSLWEDTVIPMLIEIANELTNWLTPMFGDRSLTLKPDLDDVPALEAKRTARFDRIANAGFLSDAEKRRMLGMGKSAKD